MRSRYRIIGETICLFAAALSMKCLAQPDEPAKPESPAIVRRRPTPPPPTGGPYLHKIQSASSEDGLSFRIDSGVLVEHGSVPATVMLPDSRIRTYYVDASKMPETANV